MSPLRISSSCVVPFLVAACSSGPHEQVATSHGALDGTPVIEWQQAIDTPFTAATVQKTAIDYADEIVVLATGSAAPTSPDSTLVVKLDVHGKTLWTLRDDGGAMSSMAINLGGDVVVAGGATLRLYDTKGAPIAQSTRSDGAGFVDVTVCDDQTVFALAQAAGVDTAHVVRMTRDTTTELAIAAARGAAIRCDGAGGAYAAVSFVASAAETRAGVVHVDAKGALAWTFTAPDRSAASGLTVDGGGNVVLGGVAQIQRSEFIQEQLRATKIDAAGNGVWTTTIDGVRDHLRSIAEDSEGRVTLAGVAGGNTMMTEFRTVELDADGHVLWSVDDAWGSRVAGPSGLDLTPTDDPCVIGSYSSPSAPTSALVVYDGDDGTVGWKLSTDAPFAFSKAAIDGDGHLSIAGASGGRLQIASYVVN